MKIFSERLKELRIKKDLSQRQLAKQIGVSQSTILAWENDKSNPRANHLKRLHEIFNVSVDYLAGLKD